MREVHCVKEDLRKTMKNYSEDTRVGFVPNNNVERVETPQTGFVSLEKNGNLSISCHDR
jgi:hypothetical protein